VRKKRVDLLIRGVQLLAQFVRVVLVGHGDHLACRPRPGRWFPGLEDLRVAASGWSAAGRAPGRVIEHVQRASGVLEKDRAGVDRSGRSAGVEDVVRDDTGTISRKRREDA
jgi:hypothetical protein